MKAHALFALLVLAHCGGGNDQPAASPDNAQTTAATTATPADTTAPAATTAPATKAPALDLSTEDKARQTILDALKRDDKEAFKKSVSQRILAKQKDFDAWYAVWKSAADKSPDKFKKITVTKEGDEFKLDEN